MNAPRTPRFASVDALRGCTVAGMLLVNDPGDWDHVYAPLEHSAWHGCTPTDLIFPFFLFVVGVSVALAIEPRREQGVARSQLLRAAWWRALRILGVGLAINLLAAWLLPGAHLRIPGVLQRIALCFAGVAAIALYTHPRQQWVIAALLLMGYAALLQLGGTLDPFVNVVSRSDSALFGRFVYLIDPVTGRGHDPEGLLGTVPSLATSVFGLIAGRWLRTGASRKLALAGIAALALGFVWSWWLPLNKNLWTPSFVLWTAGWATVALLACHLAVDRAHWPAFGRRFGINAIAAYAGSELMQILLPALDWQQPLYERLFASWIRPLAGPSFASLTWALAFVALWWLIVWAMDRRRLYLKL